MRRRSGTVGIVISSTIIAVGLAIGAGIAATGGGAGGGGGGSFGAWSFVQGANACPATNTNTLALPGATAAGDLLVMEAGALDATNASTFNTPTDTQGNTWHAATPLVHQSPATNSYMVQEWYTFGSSAAADTVSFGVTGSASFDAIAVLEYHDSGSAVTTDRLDVSGNGKDPGTTGTTLATGSFTTTQDNDLVVAAGGANNGNITHGTGYTAREPADNTCSMQTEDKIQTPAGSTTATQTASVASNWSIVAGSFKLVAGAGTTTTGGGAGPLGLPTAGDTAAGSTGWRHAIASLTAAGSGGNPVAGVDTPGACGTGGSVLTVSSGVYTIHGSAGAGGIVDGCAFGTDAAPATVIMASGGTSTIKASEVKGKNPNGGTGAAIRVTSGGCPCNITDVEITTAVCTVDSITCFSPSSPILDSQGVLVDPYLGRPEHIDQSAAYLVSNPAAVACCDSQRQDRSISTEEKANTQPVTITRLYSWDTQRGLTLTGSNNVTMTDSYEQNYNPHNRCAPYGANPPLGFDAQPYDYAHSSEIRSTSGTSNMTFTNDVQIIGPCSNASGVLALYPESTGNHDITVNGGLWEITAPGNSGGYGAAAGFSPPGCGGCPAPPGGESPNYNITIKNVHMSVAASAALGYSGVTSTFGFGGGLAQNWTYGGGNVGPVGGCNGSQPAGCPGPGNNCNSQPCEPASTNTWQDNLLYAPGTGTDGQCIGPDGVVGGTAGSGTAHCLSVISH